MKKLSKKQLKDIARNAIYHSIGNGNFGESFDDTSLNLDEIEYIHGVMEKESKLIYDRISDKTVTTNLTTTSMVRYFKEKNYEKTIN